MAKNPAILPSWVQTLGAMLDEGFDDQGYTKVSVTVWCTACGSHRRIDIAALAVIVGREYSLVNRRCRCRLKPGCAGWNRFNYAFGRHTWNRHLNDEATAARWLIER